MVKLVKDRKGDVPLEASKWYKLTKKEYANFWLGLTGFYTASILSYLVNNSIPMGIFSLICLVLLIYLIYKKHKETGLWVFPLNKLIGHFTTNK